ncbi:plasmid mobilization relaxosome protein MobC [Kitasatospora sp. NPDC001309]|uniref:plasmid mobilization relaxosome protein MobC n=1 Tax=Kitasatospora sp. NPDC001309 TaxID=3364013 RepID=UPI0036AA5189
MGDEQLHDDKASPVRRRSRADDARTARVRFWFTETEMEVVRLAAARDNQSVGAWVAERSLAVAKEVLVPVSPAARDVLAELMRARSELSRIGSNVNQIARAVNSDAEVTQAQLDAVLERATRAVERVDEATVQLMRERRARS